MYQNEVIWRVTKERQTELLAMTECDRLLRDRSNQRSGRRARLFVNIGDLLVKVGTHLKSRYAPVTPRPSGLDSC